MNDVKEDFLRNECAVEQRHTTVSSHDVPCELFLAPYYIYNRENSSYTGNKPEPLLLKTT